MKQLCQFIYEKPYAPVVGFTLAAVFFIVWYFNQHPFNTTGILLLALLILTGIFLFILAYALSQAQNEMLSDKSIDKTSTQTPIVDQCAETKLALKEAQTQLVEQEKMASIGMLTAGIAHEIKNPLNFINNFSEMTTEMLVELKNELAKIPEKTQETTQSIEGIIDDIASNCKKINEHGKRAESIIKNMLLQSRSAEAEKAPCDVNALLEEYLNLAYHGMRAQNNKFNAKIEKNLDPTLTNIIVSPQGIGRVFLNIIHNGLYAANERWAELLSEQKQSSFIPTITVTTCQDSENIIIKIKDNGNGIPESLRKKIFEPFFTTKPPGLGTGLGLPICYDIVVKEHAGKLDIQSQPGEFTEFIITLSKNTTHENKK